MFCGLQFQNLAPNLVYVGSRVLIGLSLDESCWAVETAWFQKPCYATNQSRTAQYAFTNYKGLSAQLWSQSSVLRLKSPACPLLVNRTLTKRQSLQERWWWFKSHKDMVPRQDVIFVWGAQMSSRTWKSQCCK